MAEGEDGSFRASGYLLDKPNYDEFDDVVRNGSFASSQQARDEIGRLLRERDLRQNPDPGGIEITGKGIRIHLSGCDDIEDLHDLRKTIAGVR